MARFGVDFGVRASGRYLVVAGAVVLLAMSGCGGAQGRKAHFLERGRQYLAEGRYDKARIEFRNALQIAPNDPEARFESGVAAENLSAFSEAARLYEGALDLSPDYLQARRALARLLFLGGEFQEALNTMDPALRKHPDDSILLGLRAGARARLDDDLSGPIADAERAVKLDPHNVEAIQILAGLYDRQKRDADTLKTLERGVADNPKSIPLHRVLADYDNANERPEQAERLLKEVIAQEPKNTEYRIALAHFYATRDKVPEAEATLRKALADLPKNKVLTQALIDFLQTRRGAAAAEQELRSMLAANPKDEEVPFVLANLFLSNGQADKAREVFQSLVNRKSSSKQAVLTAKTYLAAMQFARNDIPGTETLLKEVLNEDARNSDALQLRARIALMQGKPRDAIVDLRSVLNDQPNNAGALQLLARAHLATHEPALALQVLERAVDSNQNDNSLRFDLVSLLLSQGPADRAQRAAEFLAQREPRNPVFLRAAFTAELKNKDIKAAANTAEVLVAVQPERAEGYYLAGVAAEASDDFEGAIKKFEKSLEIAPGTHEPLQALVRVYARQGKMGLALERLDKFASAHPQDPFPKVLSGELLLAQKKLPEAAATLKAAIAIDPKNLPPYQGLARIQFLQHNLEGALQTLRDAQARVSVPEIAAADLGALYQNVGRTDDALKAYEESLRLNPKYEVAANNLAVILAEHTDTASLDRALELAKGFENSSDPAQIDTLGWVRLKRGETNSALELLGKALKAAPGNASVRYHLAMAQLKVGQTEIARGNLQEALKTSTNFEGIGEARTVLASLAPAAPALPH